MRYTFKALFTGGVLLFLAVFSNVKLSAQNQIVPECIGTWILDSVQVREIMPDSIVEKTLPGDDINFYGNWMWQLILDSKGHISYTDSRMQNTSSAPYTIKDRNGNTATLTIDITGDYSMKIQMLSESSMLAIYSYKTINNKMQNVEIFWNMYYCKSTK